MIGRLLNFVLTNLGLTKMSKENNKQIEPIHQEVGESIFPENSVIIHSLGAEFTTRDAQTVWANAAKHETEFMVPIVAIKNFSLRAGDNDLVDTHLKFDLDEVDIEIINSTDTFLRNGDLYHTPVAPVNDRVKRTTTGVNVLYRNLGSRPILVTKGTVIGYIRHRPQVKTVLNLTA